MSIQETVKSIPCPVNVSKSVKHHLVAKAFEKQQIISRFERKFKHPVREHTFGDYSIGGYGYCLHETEILSLARAEGSPWHWHPKFTTCQSQQRELAQLCINSSRQRKLRLTLIIYSFRGSMVTSCFPTHPSCSIISWYNSRVVSRTSWYLCRYINLFSCCRKNEEPLTSSC